MRLLRSTPLLLLFVIFRVAQSSGGTSSCYDAETGAPQRCTPELIPNIAADLAVEVTSTCGERHPTRFCTSTEPYSTATRKVDTDSFSTCVSENFFLFLETPLGN